MSAESVEYEEEIVYYYEGEEIDEAKILADLENADAPRIKASPSSHFKGEILPTDLSFPYKFTLFLVSLLMIMLPLLYVGILGAAGWATWWNFDANFLAQMKDGNAEKGHYLIHAVITLAGVFMVVFMIKPIFVRVRNDYTPLTLSRTEEPELFDFVSALCRQVGAPAPTRIDVNCEVNAAAGLRSGIKSITSNDLVLTIGLPLAEGLNMREFAGVLAHEFGHFAQRGGMGLTHIIRRVNFWLARVVYQRDMWDYHLERAAKTWNFRIGFFIHLIRFTIWLFRRVFSVLVWIGNLVSCIMSRHMEYDADSYEVKIAGSKVFGATSRKFHVFGAAGQVALSELQEVWQSGRLADNYPKYVVARAKDLPPEVKDHIEFISTQQKTGLFDTHPANTDRIVAAEALNEPGVFRYEGPVSELFSDFDALCKRATKHFYVGDIGLMIEDKNIVSTEETMAEAKAQREEGNAVDEFIGGINPIALPVTFTEIECRPIPNKQQIFDNILNARSEVKRLAKEYAPQVEQHQEAWVSWLNAHFAIYLTRARIQFKAKAFNLPKADHQSALEVRKKAARKMEKAAGNLSEIRDWAKLRFTANLQILNDNDYTGYFENCAELRADAAAQTNAIAAFGRTHEEFDQLRYRFECLQLLLEVAQNGEVTEELKNQIERLASEVLDHVYKIDKYNGRVKFPFPHVDGEITIAQYTKPERNSSNEIEKALIEGSSMLDKLPALYFRILGRLVVISQTVEKAMLKEMGLPEEQENAE